ncbi:MAG: transcription-repair coupling factor, partial [Thermoanaerobaculia bacterium]|nr:transcription-repair coupling factor [Thermoanaerobaculia bacterium]
PLTRLDEIEKYSGIEGVAPRLDRLGGSSWSRTKSRVRAGMRKLAIDLLALYAERQVQRAPTMAADSELQAEFEAAFEFEETPDQLEATAAIKADLERSRPMDRLLCGDVGFGKTEVAMRAAFKVVEGGHQVAVLAPTTILADQHLETFRERFERFPVEIDMISRFRTAAEIRRVTRAAREGRVDILIGTHRILGSDIDIPRLGLLIVDEEQRFGVAQKERFTELRKNVHVLSMSATPVPRTLQLALAGVRDLSVIETPPRDRMAVETAIVSFNRQLVAEAVEFELARQGQVYYVYNHVDGIESMRSKLAEIVPQAKITVGHGQMNERELAERMHAFKRGEHDVLLATTIIENGIDIPNVNTMLIHRADRFGLAQLYQLRGRVGRSDQLAYCYLLVPEERPVSEVARRRLAAIREFTELGAGFRIAARDLEIRGAGNLLGAEQSGHMAAVGIETYLRMLEETVQELKGESTEAPPSVALDLPQPPSIPTEYVGDANLRMELYRRIAAGEASREEILDELTDRFGEPPPAIDRLLDAMELKRRAEELRVQSISARSGSLRMRLRQDTRIDVDRLVRLVSERDDLSFSPNGVLTVDDVEPSRLVEASRRLLDLLA